jgi:hypothetical protein
MITQRIATANALRPRIASTDRREFERPLTGSASSGLIVMIQLESYGPCRPNATFQPRRFIVALAAAGCKCLLASR